MDYRENEFLWVEKYRPRKLEDCIETLDGVLQIISGADPKDFELIVDIEPLISTVLRSLERKEEVKEIDLRLIAVREAMEDVPDPNDLGD